MELKIVLARIKHFQKKWIDWRTSKIPWAVELREHMNSTHQAEAIWPSPSLNGAPIPYELERGLPDAAIDCADWIADNNWKREPFVAPLEVENYPDCVD